ncbi:TPA: transglycosylase domain-containing protein [Streptococcus suis]
MKPRSRHDHKNKTLQGLKNLWRYYRGWKWLIFITMSIGLLLSSYLVLLAKTTDVDTLQEALKSHTTIYDVNDQVAGTLQDQKGTYVSLDQISPEMREVLITTEDKRFYEHVGFDPIGLSRAFVRLLINRNTSGGGGSTITQQLVKNAFLTLDQTFERKLKEFFLALEVEKQYTKEEILEMYLNHAYFGNGVWGVEDAAFKYFGHGAATIDYEEAIVLTGILKGPNLFNPIDDYEAAIERRDVVTELMIKEGVISLDYGQSIIQSGIETYDAYYQVASHEYPSYFDAVISEAIERTNIPEEDILSKGYQIYTHLNTGYQTTLDASYDNTWLFGDDGVNTIVQSASLVLDPTTGGIAAVYGGRGEYTFRGFNRATDMQRSPGSTIKPLAVYVTALEKGYKIHDMVQDKVQAYGTNNYAPENYDRYSDPSGQVELYYALAQSKNTSAVYLMDQFGIDLAVKKLEQFGIGVTNADKSLTLALGALERGVSPLQLASAYSAFANGGVRIEPSFIRRIEDANGKVVYSNERPTKHKVMTANVAADMTSMMLDTYGGYGTGYGAGPDLGQIAGKTGSTEVAEGDMTTRDKWMVGYTPDFTIVTWVGLDNVSDGNLDELMPSGMSALFNIQTTNLIYQSPQTAFSVPMASQTSIDTNNVAEPIFDGEWQAWLDEASQQVDQWINQAGQGMDQLWQSGQEWLQGLSLPF